MLSRCGEAPQPLHYEVRLLSLRAPSTTDVESAEDEPLGTDGTIDSGHATLFGVELAAAPPPVAL